MTTGTLLTIDSISSLRAYAAGSPPSTFNVQGYAAPGDGGGGLFVYDPFDMSSTDNGGTIIVDSLGRRWYRLYSGDIYAEWFGVVGTGDETTTINSMVSSVSAVAVAASTQLTIRFNGPSYQTAGIAIKPNLCLDFGRATITKTVSGGSMLYTTPVLISGSYYGTYNNITIRGGTFNLNGKTAPGHIVYLLYTIGLRLENVTVTHQSQNLSWAFALGGRHMIVEGCKVLGGTVTLQDGIHIYHGQYICVNGGYVESGDDALPCGGEPTDPILSASPDPIRYVTFNGVTVNATQGTAMKCYVNTGAPANANWQVTDVIYTGIVGQCGVTSGQGIAFEDLTAPAIGSGSVQRCVARDFSLIYGNTATNPGTAYAIELNSTVDCAVHGKIQMLLPASGVPSGYRVVYDHGSQDSDISVKCPNVPTALGIYVGPSNRTTVRDSLVIGSSATNGPLLELFNATDFKASGNRFLNQLSGQSVIAFAAGGTTSFGEITRNTLSHAASPTAGFGIGIVSSTNAAYLDISHNNLSACFAPISGVITGVAFFNIHDNLALSTAVVGTATVAAGATSVTVTHGSSIGADNFADYQAWPTSAWGSATTWWLSNIGAASFNINVNIAPGGPGMTFGWRVDTGKNPNT
ncbi:MAG: hypothetical protein JWR07_2312 [Nevskia sp.]|nr:hypothetical protein [Nevskia sp.]